MKKMICVSSGIASQVSYDFVVPDEADLSKYTSGQLMKVKDSKIKAWVEIATAYYEMQAELKALAEK